MNGHAVCSCQIDYVGIPPQCRPECVVSSECPQDKACIKQKCTDPCPNMCGENAFCKVVNHNPICSCTRGFTGDPFTRCNRDECKMKFPTPIVNRSMRWGGNRFDSRVENFGKKLSFNPVSISGLISLYLPSATQWQIWQGWMNIFFLKSFSRVVNKNSCGLMNGCKYVE